MGLKDFFNNLKEENKGFGAAMARMNDRKNFIGNVNRRIKDGDFKQTAYLNIYEGTKAVIYGAGQDDYVFGKDDVIAFDIVDMNGPKINVGNDKLGSVTVNLGFSDGKTAQVDVIALQLDIFNKILGK